MRCGWLGPADSETDALEFLRAQFKAVFRLTTKRLNAKREAFYHFTHATDAKSMSAVIAVVEESMLRDRLATSVMM